MFGANYTPINISGLRYFKGIEYGPAKDLSERRQRYRMMNLEEMDKYNKKVKKSKGFDVDGCTGCLAGRIIPIRPNTLTWESAITAAKFAIEKRRENDEGVQSLVFKALKKANLQPAAGTMYYVTFSAKDNTDGRVKTYRAKVWQKAVVRDWVLNYFAEFKSPGGVLVAFTALVKKIKSENPSMTHAKARAAASKKWKLMPDSEKQSLIHEQV